MIQVMKIYNLVKVCFRLIQKIPAWIKMPELDNLKSVQRLAMIVINAAMCVYCVRAEMVKSQEERDEVEREIILVQDIIDYTIRLARKYAHEIPETLVLTKEAGPYQGLLETGETPMSE